MMKFRWTVAGGKQFPFNRNAIGEIHRLAGGITRDICKLAHETLLRAVVLRLTVIDRDLVTAAAAETFIQRRDSYSRQLEDGRYICVHESLIDYQ